MVPAAAPRASKHERDFTMVQQRIIPSEYMAPCCIVLAELLGPAHALSERFCTRHREGSMGAQNGISRRHILALSAAAGNLAIGSGLRGGLRGGVGARGKADRAT